ncbi:MULTISPECIES: monovalent cation/H+ antiporter complex subunit F [Deefgea]|uniref:Multiple resistance and pH regulation protein F n=1 Tax=Deefgea chitinilytica TaxID=570276 RepID=A0ABS2CEA1_9NEIS|nr:MULTISPECIES: monovalent cation/H+ antiporter complex subunit F [Deefgea]MBM5571716.1 multiple resistance and pH regulation protein F [Deefgea chitinilytica]MBM9888951.1 multiple resistance and pH regulation protein F [Deefgea sp. CFH1-16]
MNEFLMAAACLVLLLTALSLYRLFREPSDVDRVLAAQLIGTGGVAILLLLSAASNETAIIDVALSLALLAAMASIAFVKAAASGDQRDDGEQE